MKLFETLFYLKAKIKLKKQNQLKQQHLNVVKSNYFVISMIGSSCRSLSAWIFLQKKFTDPVFIYYRLLCLVYILQLAHGIPLGILYSNRFLLRYFSYYNSMFVIYYHLLAGLALIHFEDTLQMAILLTRMKIFNSFVRKHFTQKPQLIASSLFLTCLFIDSPVAFALKISSYHYYTDNKQENVNTFYIMTASDFSSTPYGQLLLAFTSFFLNLLLTLVVGVILNIVSVCQYKLYLRGKKQRDEAYKLASNPGKSEQVLKRQEMTR